MAEQEQGFSRIVEAVSREDWFAGQALIAMMMNESMARKVIDGDKDARELLPPLCFALAALMVAHSPKGSR